MNEDSAADTQTISYYNANAEIYDKATFDLKLETPWKEFLSCLPPGGRILDIGCGSGRDIKHFINLGYEVQGLEPSKNMAKLARLNTGAVIHELSVTEMAFGPTFDGIWACASLLHIDKNEFPKAYNRIMKALKHPGVFYFSLKLGLGTNRKSDGRLFSNYTESEIIDSLKLQKEVQHFKYWRSSDTMRQDTVTWLNFLISQ